MQARGGRIRELEEELRVVKAELQQEKEEKVDLVTEKVRLMEVENLNELISLRNFRIEIKPPY